MRGFVRNSLAVRLSPEVLVALDDPRLTLPDMPNPNPPERSDEVYHRGGGVTSHRSPG